MRDSVKACTAVEHARAGEERAEDGEAERGAQQRQVPDPQHPAALLHHHRVDVGGAGEPRQEAGVLDRVPRPVAAPAEHLVAPPGAEHDADGEEAPGEQRPAAGLQQPALADPPGHQRGDGEGERHGEADVAEVEHRRVERHERGGSAAAGSGPARRAGTAPATCVNGLAGPNISRKKKAQMTNSVTRAQPTSGSSRRSRKRHATDQQVAGRARAPTAGSSPRARPTARRR